MSRHEPKRARADEGPIPLAKYVIRDCRERGLSHFFGIPGSGAARARAPRVQIGTLGVGLL